MTLQPASLGRTWLGPQAEKGTAATTFYGFKANLAGLTPQELIRNVGALVGGSLVPPGSIKTAAWSGGALIMPPALDDQIGWLLYSFAGSVSSVDNGDGTYTHYFPSGADSVAVEKLLSARRSVPGSSVLYELMIDQQVYRLLWGLTPGEPATLRAEMIGREPSNPDGAAWTFSGKSETTVPITCKGSFELPDGSPLTAATGVVLNMINVVPDVARVLVGGSYYPHSFPVINRAIGVQFSFLWENPTLYQSLYYSAGSWNPVIYSGSFNCEVQSPGFITGALPYKLEFYAQAMNWTCQPLQLRGGDLIEMGMTGTLKDSDSGHDWYLALTNGTEEYAWPT
jgi:hypothetical protein